MAPGLQRNACLSCRQRKLKCDRQQPCANCIARSVECAEQLLPPPSRAFKRPLAQEPDSSTLSSILSRLDQIESYISPAQNSRHVSMSTPIGNQLNMIRYNVPSFVPQTQEPPSDKATESIPSEDQMQATKYSRSSDFLAAEFRILLFPAITTDSGSHVKPEPIKSTPSLASFLRERSDKNRIVYCYN